MVELVADAVRFHAIHEKTLRLSLAEIARHPYGDGVTVNQALEAGCKQAVAHSMADGILTKQEESRLREFRDRLALDSNAVDSVQLTSYLYPRQCQRKGRACPLRGNL